LATSAANDQTESSNLSLALVRVGHHKEATMTNLTPDIALKLACYTALEARNAD